MFVFRGHGIEVLDVIVEKCLVLAFFLHPERKDRIYILLRELR